MNTGYMNAGSGQNMGFGSGVSRPAELALRFTPGLISLTALKQASGRDAHLPKPLSRARPDIRGYFFRGDGSVRTRGILWLD